MRLLARKVRSDVAGLAGQVTAASMRDELVSEPHLVENRLPTPLVLSATDDGLALTATARAVPVETVEPPERESAVAKAAPVEARAVATGERPVLHVVPPYAPAPAETPETQPATQVRADKPRVIRRRVRLADAAAPLARAGEPQIEFRDVSVSFGSITALRGISFTINAGELVFLVGASGAGKTTTFRLISGQMRPGKGQVWVDRVPVHKARRHGVAVLRRRIGFVGEDYSLLANRTSLENVEFALRMSDLSLPGSEVKRRALAELRNVALLARASALPGQLSTGQRQRLALARALVTRPLVLLADEPTAGLDARNALRVMQLLQRAASRQTAVLVATHDRPMAASVKARILVLDKGRLAGDFPSWVDLCRAE